VLDSASVFAVGEALDTSEGDGDGDMDPFRRLRRRADNASSGADCLDVSVVAGLRHQSSVCVHDERLR